MIYKVAIPPRCAVTANHPSFHKVGLHQCPSEKKGQGAPGHRQPVPSRVPFARQTAPKPRASSYAASRFTTEKDSLAEGNAFEISVPRQIGRGFQGFRQIREIAPPSPKIRRMIERAIGSQTPPTRRSAVRIWEEQRARGGAGARLCCRSARDTAAACVVRLLPAPLVPWMWIAGDLDAQRVDRSVRATEQRPQVGPIVRTMEMIARSGGATPTTQSHGRRSACQRSRSHRAVCTRANRR